jgi:hypothetical protein
LERVIFLPFKLVDFFPGGSKFMTMNIWKCNFKCHQITLIRSQWYFCFFFLSVCNKYIEFCFLGPLLDFAIKSPCGFTFRLVRIRSPLPYMLPHSPKIPKYPHFWTRGTLVFMIRNCALRSANAAKKPWFRIISSENAAIHILRYANAAIRILSSGNSALPFVF